MMKIPLYTSQATPSSEAPGRSMQARMQSEPFIRAELEKGNTFGTAAAAVAEFADMRYKMVREVQLNDALLAAEESLRDETEALSKSKDLYNILDGDDPLWNKNVDGIRRTLREKVGKDKSALRTFDERFKQAEMSNRFKLRGVVDTKIEQAIQAQRARRLRNIENDAVGAATYDEVMLRLNDAGIDSQRLASVLKGNINALKSQEYTMVKNVLGRRLSKILDSSQMPSKAISRLRDAVVDPNLSDEERAAALMDPALNGGGFVEYELMKLLPLDDRIAILRSGENISGYIDGPTLEEQRLKLEADKLDRIAKGNAEQAENLAKDYISRLKEGQTLPGGSLEELSDLAQKALPGLDEAGKLQLSSAMADLGFINSLSDQVKAVADLKGVEDLIIEMQKGDKLDGEGIQPREQLGLEFLRSFRDNMKSKLAQDPVGYASETGAIRVSPIDLSPQAVQLSTDTGEDVTGVRKRIRDAIDVRGHYNLSGPLQILTPGEVSAYAPALNRGTAIEKMQSINSIEKLFGEYAPAVFQQLAKDAPLTMHIAGLMKEGLNPEAEVILRGIDEIAVNGNPLSGSDATDANQTMMDLVGAAYELLPGKLNAELKKNIKDTALAYYAEAISRRASKDFDSDLWETSVQVATGYNPRTETGGIQMVRGVPTLLPANRKAEEIENALTNVTAENFSQIATVSGTLDEETFRSIKTDDDHALQVLGKRNGKLIYGVVYGVYGSSDYAIITDPDGNDISFTADDLIAASNRPSKPVVAPGQDVRLETTTGVQPSPEPVVQEPPNQQAFNLKDYDPSDPKMIGDAARAMKDAIIDNFPDLSSVTEEDVRTFADQSGYKYSGNIITVGLMMALNAAGKQ